MTTKFFQQKIVLGNENAQAQNAPAKAKILFRKVAPLVAAGFLAAGCGAAQKPPACQMDKNGSYLLEGNCVIVEVPQWKNETPKEEPKPAEQRCGANAPLDCQARALQIVSQFSQKIKEGGFGAFSEIISSSSANRIFLEDDGRAIHNAGDFILAYNARYGIGKINFQLIGPAGPSIGYEVETNVESKVGGADDEGMTPMERATAPNTTATQTITPSGERAAAVLFGCEVSAYGKGEQHILEFNPEGNPRMGKAVAIYDDLSLYVVFLTPYLNAWEVRQFDMAKAFGPDRRFSVASWTNGRDSALFLIPDSPGPSDKIYVIPLIKNEKGAYFIVNGLPYLQYDGRKPASVESQ